MKRLFLGLRYGRLSVVNPFRCVASLLGLVFGKKYIPTPIGTVFSVADGALSTCDQESREIVAATDHSVAA